MRRKPELLELDGNEETMNAFYLTTGQRLTFTALMVLSFMAALDGSSISVALPALAMELHASAIEAFWAGTSYLLCCAICQPIFGSLSILFCRKIFIMIAIFFFFIGAILAGSAHNVFRLLLGRSLQGIGGGGLITLTGIVIADYVPLKRRAVYFGLLSSTWALGSVIGPVIGGCFAERSTWRWMFYINFPFIGIGRFLIVCFMPRSSTLGAFRTQFHKIDFIGIFIFVISASSFLIPLSWGGIMFPWNSWHTLAALILGIMGLVAFGAYECLYSTFPLIPPVIFRNKSTAISLIGYCAMGFLLWCELYYLPLYFEAVKGYNSIIAGVALFPATLTIAPIAILTGSLIAVTGNCYWTVLTSWALCTLGLGLLCLLQVETSTPAWIFLCMVSGLGFGTGIPAIAVAVQASVLPEHVSIAITLSTFSRSFGQALGVAVGGATFENRARTILLQNSRLASVADRYSRDAFDVLNFLDQTDKATRFQIRSAYVQSLRAIWAIGVGVSGITLIVSMFAKRHNIG